jgi:serine/threonine protein kinase
MAAWAGHCTQHRGRALASDHTKSIVHRDIKSENVICAGDGAVKILDFGVAKFVSPPDAGAMTGPGATAVTQGGAAVGTIAYMSAAQPRGTSSRRVAGTRAHRVPLPRKGSTRPLRLDR